MSEHKTVMAFCLTDIQIGMAQMRPMKAHVRGVIEELHLHLDVFLRASELPLDDPERLSAEEVMAATEWSVRSD